MGSACPWSRAWLTINEKQNNLSLLDDQLSENSILSFGFFKKSEFETKFVGIIVKKFSFKNVSQTVSKIFQ